ncbi:hypothetical protein EV383_2489 [Pseudonocardia sediminis]|uniref:Uncharacterized protein n=1 Tax=Pseudonocardia sediminis TaxID=1397368 RepID=A0A4Q7UZB2_PSEST|nr:hypothetical protein EV383_2489 [Pseudonocardia sediminis]
MRRRQSGIRFTLMFVLLLGIVLHAGDSAGSASTYPAAMTVEISAGSGGEGRGPADPNQPAPACPVSHQSKHDTLTGDTRRATSNDAQTLPGAAPASSRVWFMDPYPSAGRALGGIDTDPPVGSPSLSVLCVDRN